MDKARHPPPGAATRHPRMEALGQHVVLSQPRDSYVVTRSRPYLLKVLAVIVLHLINSVLYAALYAVLNSVLRAYAAPLVPVSPCPRAPSLRYAFFSAFATSAKIPAAMTTSPT